MGDNDIGFTTVSISDNLIKRIDKIFSKAGFTTRGGYINNRLRTLLERDELRYSGGDNESDGKHTNKNEQHMS